VITIDLLELSDVDAVVSGWNRLEVDGEEDEYVHLRDAVFVGDSIGEWVEVYVVASHH